MSVITNNNIRDLSVNEFPITKINDVNISGISPTSNENYSVFFYKNSTPLSVIPSSIFNFRGNDFTIETWLNVESINEINFNTGNSNGFCLIDSPQTTVNKNFSLILKLNKGNNFVPTQTFIGAYYDKTPLVEGYIPQLFLQKWLHIAVTRRNNTQFLLHINGKLIAQKSISVDIVNLQSATIGGVNPLFIQTNSPAPFEGYLADLRVSNIARYNTVDFNLPLNKHITDSYTTFLTFRTYNLFNETISLSLGTIRPLFNTFAEILPELVPYSPFNTTRNYNPSLHNGGCKYLDGGLKINTASNPFNLNNSWSLDFWVYTSSRLESTNTQTLFTTLSGTEKLIIAFSWSPPQGEPVLEVNYYSNQTLVVSKLFPLTNNSFNEHAWSHIQITHKNFFTDHGTPHPVYGNSAFAVYVNGQIIMLPDSQYNFSITSLSSVCFGVEPELQLFNSQFNGIMSGINFNTTAYKGQELVTLSTNWLTPFNVSLTPKTPSSDTYFLINFTDIDVYDRTGSAEINIYGNVLSDSIITKNNTPSYKFNGVDSYFSIKPTHITRYEFSQDFTIESWFYYTSLNTSSATRGIFQISNTDNGLDDLFGTGTSLEILTDNKQLRLGFGFLNQPSLFFIPQNCTILENIWQHFAIVRHQGKIKFFLNGVEKTVTNNEYTGLILGETLCLGGSRDLNSLFSGNIFNFRITKDLARYTAGFIPPDIF